MIEDHSTEVVRTTPIRKILLLTLAILSVLAVSVFIWLLVKTNAPANFPTESTITIAPGTSVSEIVEQFQTRNYVKSSELLYVVLTLLHDTKDIKAGTYTFNEPLSVFAVADLITQIGPKDDLISVTIPEGTRVRAIAVIADELLPKFNSSTFVSYAEEDEGRLFPDTYFVPDTFTDSALYDLMRETYEEKVGPLREQIEAHPLTEAEILVLASIIEREANSEESMRMVSGILQNRLDIGMALQADASIEYVLDKPLSKLTPADLEIDSPYNTYLNRGLPPTPIGNPGLTAIEAVLEPAESDFFYYITDDSGTFHYARTLDEHNLNIARYLR